VALLLGAVALVPFGAVKVKMLPFDNKSEFQIVLNTPEGTTLEQTAAIAQEMAAAIRNEPEVRDLQIYAGTASPFNFNGLVRHYFMRRGPNVADMQVNLVGKGDRSDQSHDIAKRIRPIADSIAQRHGGRVAVAEVPPGPPVLQTLVAEIYGPDEEHHRLAARGGARDHEPRRRRGGPRLVRRGGAAEGPFRGRQGKGRLPRRERGRDRRDDSAGRAGAQPVDLLHRPAEREDVPIIFELPAAKRVTNRRTCWRLHVRADQRPDAPLVPLVPARAIEQTTAERRTSTGRTSSR
jgi:hypothetical protein